MRYHYDRTLRRFGLILKARAWTSYDGVWFPQGFTYTAHVRYKGRAFMHH